MRKPSASAREADRGRHAVRALAKQEGRKEAPARPSKAARKGGAPARAEGRRNGRSAAQRPPAEPAPPTRLTAVESGATSRGKYVYCIIEASDPLRFGPIGLGANPSEVYTVHFKTLAAVVSDAPLEVVDSTREHVLAHERVNETVMREHVFARGVEHLERRVGDNGCQLLEMDGVHVGRIRADSDRAKAQRVGRFDDAVHVFAAAGYARFHRRQLTGLHDPLGNLRSRSFAPVRVLSLLGRSAPAACRFRRTCGCTFFGPALRQRRHRRPPTICLMRTSRWFSHIFRSCGSSWSSSNRRGLGEFLSPDLLADRAW